MKLIIIIIKLSIKINKISEKNATLQSGTEPWILWYGSQEANH